MTTALHRELIEQVEEGWLHLRGLAERVGMEGLSRPTSVGWSAKEMLAHVAFWEESIIPAVYAMFRHQPMPPGWRFGSGDLGLAEGEWPEPDVHNAREAAWARDKAPDEVLARWDRAHAWVLSVIGTLTEDELRQEAFRERIASETYEHYRAHQAELDAMEAGWTLLGRHRHAHH